MAFHDIVTRSKTGARPSRIPITTQDMETALLDNDDVHATTVAMPTSTVTVNTMPIQTSAGLSPPVLQTRSSPMYTAQTRPKQHYSDPESELDAVFDRYETHP